MKIDDGFYYSIEPSSDRYRHIAELWWCCKNAKTVPNGCFTKNVNAAAILRFSNIDDDFTINHSIFAKNRKFLRHGSSSIGCFIINLTQFFHVWPNQLNHNSFSYFFKAFDKTFVEYNNYFTSCKTYGVQATKYGHRIQFLNTTILHKEPNNIRRKIKISVV